MIYRESIIKEEDIKEHILWNVLRIDTKSFRLPVDVFLLDESNIAFENNWPLFILFRNSYDDNSSDYMPLLVNERIVLLSDKKLNIIQDDLNKIHGWMMRYQNYIAAISNGDMLATDFLDNFSLLSKLK